MRKVYLVIMMAAGLSALSFVLSDNGKAGVTGSPGEVTCADATCHDSNGFEYRTRVDNHQRPNNAGLAICCRTGLSY
jgi:hypothetical protein